MEFQAEQGLTCRDLLLIPHLHGAAVLAGRQGLETAVTRINVMEVPDVIDWVMPGEFLMTTGYPFRDNPDAFADLIPQLAQKGVAALGIKTKRFLEEIPQHVLDLAEQHQFPIIELPPSTVFSEVVREVMQLILVHESRQLSVLQSRFQQLSELLLNGKDMEDLLATLESQLLNPLILLSSSGKIHLSPSADELISFSTMNYSDMINQLRRDRSLGVSYFVLGERKVKVMICTIQEQQESSSLLFLLGWNQELTPLDFLTLERVTILIHLEMLNAYARREVEAKYIDQFLQDWMTGRIITRKDLNLRAEACGCAIESQSCFQVVIVRWLKDQPTDTQLKRLLHLLRQQDGLHLRDILLTLIDGKLIFLLAPDRNLKEQDLAVSLRFALQQAYFAVFQFTFSLCAGQQVLSPEDVKNSYSQALRIYEISGTSHMNKEWITYQDLGVYKLLYLLPKGEELSAFCKEWMDPLELYDRRHNSSIIETLHAYFEQHENIRKTAQQLFTHHNTVIYRMERVRELLGIDLQDANDRLQLQLALKLHAMERGEEYTLKGVEMTNERSRRIE